MKRSTLNHGLLACLFGLSLGGEASAFEMVINIPPANSINGIESNTQVNVLEGADLFRLTIPSGLSGVEVNVLGGTIQNDLRAGDADRLVIDGGAIGSASNSTGATGRSVLVTGGTLGFLSATQDLTIEGGSIAFAFANVANQANISGGSIDRLRTGDAASTVIRGGRVGQLGVRPGSGSTTLRGGDFRLNGQPAAGPITFGTNSQDGNQTLTGVLEDGSTFVYGSFGVTPFADTLRDVTLVEVGIPNADPLIDLATDQVPNGLRAGQTLFAHAGDHLGDNFHANEATLNLGAGSLGRYTKMLGGELRIDGGSVGSNLGIAGTSLVLREGAIEERFSAVEGSTVTIEDGVVENQVYLRNSRLVMNGGRLVASQFGRSTLSAFQSEVVIAGGEIEEIDAGESSVEVSGGLIHRLSFRSSTTTLDISGGHVRDLSSAGQTAIRGGRIGKLTGEAELFGEFKVNGIPASGPTILSPSSVLTGVLSDGSSIVLSPLLGDTRFTLELSTVPVPPVGPGLIIAPIDPIPNGIRDGQTLIVGPRSDTGADFVSIDANLNVAGGTLGEDTVVTGGVATVSAGQVGSQLTALRGATVVVTGGTVGGTASQPQQITRILNSSTLTVLGGSIADTLQIGGTATLNADGGQLSRVRPSRGAIVTVGGNATVGLIDDSFTDYDDEARTSLLIDGGTVENVSLSEPSDVIVQGGVINQGLSISGNSTAHISGGQMRGFGAGAGATIVMTGGIVTDTVGAAGTQIGLSDAILGELILTGGEVGVVSAGKNGIVNVEGGVVRGELQAEARSSGGRAVINMSGGEVRGLLFSRRNLIKEGGTLNLSGGTVYRGFDVGLNSDDADAIVDVSGGVFGRESRVRSGSTMRLRGGEFLLNGTPVNGQVDVSGDYTLTGTLTDGSVVVLSSAAGDEFDAGTLELVNEAIPPTSPLVINSPADPTPRGLRAGQTLNLDSGASLGRHFAAVGATLNVTGGDIGYGLELVDTQATISNGSIGEAAFLHSGSTLNVDGGEVGPGTVTHNGATLNLSGGRLGEDSEFAAGSTFVMTGGTTSAGLSIGGDAVISGGVIARRIAIDRDATVELIGGDFRFNGVPVEGDVEVQLSFFPRGQSLTGVLADGTPFLLGREDRIDGSVLRFTNTNLPDAPTTTINAPIDAVPNGLRAGQTLNLNAGAATVNDFTAIEATINVNGGTVGERLEMIDSRIRIRGGTVQDDALVYGASVLTLHNGEVGDGLVIEPGPVVVNQLGGTLGTTFLSGDTVMNISGGDFSAQNNGFHSPESWAPEGSTVDLYGLAFSQGLIDLTAELMLGESLTITDLGTELSGVLGDGSNFRFLTSARGRVIANGEVTVTKLLQGDFNHDGIVDAADYTVWRDTLGQVVAMGTGADHDFDGVITDGDREVWAARFGTTVESLLAAGALSVPEPSALVLSLVLAAQAATVSRYSAC